MELYQILAENLFILLILWALLANSHGLGGHVIPANWFKIMNAVKSGLLASAAAGRRLRAGLGPLGQLLPWGCFGSPSLCWNWVCLAENGTFLGLMYRKVLGSCRLGWAWQDEELGKAEQVGWVQLYRGVSAGLKGEKGRRSSRKWRRSSGNAKDPRGNRKYPWGNGEDPWGRGHSRE